VSRRHVLSIIDTERVVMHHRSPRSDNGAPYSQSRACDPCRCMDGHFSHRPHFRSNNHVRESKCQGALRALLRIATATYCRWIERREGLVRQLHIFVHNAEMKCKKKKLCLALLIY
jgi:hypothetical protein